MKCHVHRSPLNLVESSPHAIPTSVMFTNTIIEKYSSTYIGYDVWRDYVTSFGLGNWLNNDLPTGQKGFVPSINYYDKMYGKKRWKSQTNLSLSIGQDALLTTPIQMANMTAAIANRGHYFTPHVIKKIENDSIDSRFKTPIKTKIDPVFFNVVIDGMQQVVENKELGTSTAAKLDNITVCGKTEQLKTHSEDHSIFHRFCSKRQSQNCFSCLCRNWWMGLYLGGSHR